MSPICRKLDILSDMSFSKSLTEVRHSVAKTRQLCESCSSVVRSLVPGSHAGLGEQGEERG